MTRTERLNMLRDKCVTHHSDGVIEEFVLSNDLTIMVYNDKDDDYGAYHQIHSSTNRVFPERLSQHLDRWLSRYRPTGKTK